ncbi:MAG: hypothetical protein AAGB03_09315, partial [Pseudomonadota bacterium]
MGSRAGVLLGATAQEAAGSARADFEADLGADLGVEGAAGGRRSACVRRVVGVQGHREGLVRAWRRACGACRGLPQRR